MLPKSKKKRFICVEKYKTLTAFAVEEMKKIYILPHFKVRPFFVVTSSSLRNFDLGIDF